MFLWSPKGDTDLAAWLAKYFEKPLETFINMGRERMWSLYEKIRPFDPPVGRWVSKELH